MQEIQKSNAPEQASRKNIGMWPSTLAEAVDMCERMARTDMVPKDYKGKPDNILVAIQMGVEVGLAPMQALQSICVINGRPSLFGDAPLALVRASGLLESIHEYMEHDRAVCQVRRRGESEYVERSFSEQDAKDAKLWGKDGPWQHYKTRMLQMRARAFALRDVFPDVLKGMAIREDIEDVIVTERPPIIQPREIPPAVGEAEQKTPEPEAEKQPQIQAQSGNPPHLISDKQRKRMYAIGKGAGWSDEEMKNFLLHEYQIESSTEIPVLLYDEICGFLEGGKTQGETL